MRISWQTSTSCPVLRHQVGKRRCSVSISPLDSVVEMPHAVLRVKALSQPGQAWYRLQLLFEQRPDWTLCLIAYIGFTTEASWPCWRNTQKTVLARHSQHHSPRTSVHSFQLLGQVPRALKPSFTTPLAFACDPESVFDWFPLTVTFGTLGETSCSANKSFPALFQEPGWIFGALQHLVPTC